MKQKTEKNSNMWDNNHAAYIYRDEPKVTFNLFSNRSKSVEQAEYYGEDTSTTENSVGYSMKVNFSNVGKEVRIQDKFKYPSLYFFYIFRWYRKLPILPNFSFWYFHLFILVLESIKQFIKVTFFNT